jgi:predicted O-methyltransferase YrrM
MALLPAQVRRMAPPRLRDDVRLRAAAVGVGLIPPRTLHSEAEAELLGGLGGEARRAVEIGVYEGASAAVLAAAMAPGSELHLIDPFGHHPMALPVGWGATEWASRRVVGRAARRSGTRVVWHVTLSQRAAAAWSDPVELVFIDGDHSERACALDWALWHPFVAAGGHVAFHDARADQPGGRGLPGPTAVVRRHFRVPEPVPGWEIVKEVDRTVVVRRGSGRAS